MPPEHVTNGWNEWSKYVLKELERLNSCYHEMDKKLNRITVDIAKLKVKSGIWGLIGGAVPVVIGLGIWFLRTLK